VLKAMYYRTESPRQQVPFGELMDHSLSFKRRG